jgi:hypothetical protein
MILVETYVPSFTFFFLSLIPYLISGVLSAVLKHNKDSIKKLWERLWFRLVIYFIIIIFNVFGIPYYCYYQIPYTTNNGLYLVFEKKSIPEICFVTLNTTNNFLFKNNANITNPEQICFSSRGVFYYLKLTEIPSKFLMFILLNSYIVLNNYEEIRDLEVDPYVDFKKLLELCGAKKIWDFFRRKLIKN